jgi:4-alpha-glucanotransferase
MVRSTFPALDIIAEDLGFLTDDTRKFFRESGFDGMKVLLFAFDEQNSEYLPHNHIKSSVVYTSTHDTPTVLQWICQADSDTLGRAMDYLGAPSVYTLGDYFLRGAFSSVAERVIVPLQDWLKIGCAGRINVPGTTVKNWLWRIKDSELTKNLSEKILSYTKIYNRFPEE